MVAEACYSTTSGTTSTAVCTDGSTAPGSGLNCDPSILACGHGTHVAGIVAGKNSTFSGVAKDATLIAIQIFSKFSATYSACGGSPCVLTYGSDQIAGLQHVYDLRNTYNISSVNMSIGGGSYSTYCDSVNTSEKAAIDALRSVGIATVIASGNDGYSSSISSPACISTAVSVGATTKSDLVASYSNSAAILNLLAPGSSIYSSLPGNDFQSWSGTSMATPHVAGAWAVLKSANPNASVNKILNALVISGKPIADSRNGIVKSRIKLDAAVRLILTSSIRTDFDADGKNDLAVWRPTDGTWNIINSFTNTQSSVAWGIAGDTPVEGDYDGDGKTDIAVWRSTAGTWFIIESSTGKQRSVAWGTSGDTPVPGDYDGDGKTDIAVWRSTAGTWFIIESSTGKQQSVAWGTSGDTPVPGDYDGDGKTDIAVWRPSDGTWYIIASSTGKQQSVAWGTSGDVPVPGDYDGDGKTDIAVWRPSNGSWYILNSANNTSSEIQWGMSGDIPVPADYENVGKSEVAVWRPSNGVWYILNPDSSGQTSVQWGQSSDKPIRAGQPIQ